MQKVVYVASVAALLWAQPSLAHEGEAGHTHDAGGGPAPPAVQPDGGDPSLNATVEVGGSSTTTTTTTSAGTSQSRPLPNDDPDDDEGASSYRPRTLEDYTWRRRIRDTEDSDDLQLFDPNHFLFELRFGPYWPEVDEDYASPGPYEDFFGTKGRFYFGIEFDWLFLDIPYVLSAGPAFGVGVTRMSGKTRLASDPTQTADKDTNLTIFPMHVSAAVRVDGLVRGLGIPIIPYGKVGFGFAPWRVTGGGANRGSGVSGGLHLALGGSIALNAFDQDAAKTMEADTGIRYAHLFGEWMWANLDKGLNVGTSTFVVGIGLEL